jgi:hypothetical protein
MSSSDLILSDPQFFPNKSLSERLFLQASSMKATVPESTPLFRHPSEGWDPGWREILEDIRYFISIFRTDRLSYSRDPSLRHTVIHKSYFIACMNRFLDLRKASNPSVFLANAGIQEKEDSTKWSIT